MQISDVASWIGNADNFGTVVTVASTLIALILGLIIGGIIVSNQSGSLQRTMDELAKAGVVTDVLDCTNEVVVWSQLSPASQAASDRAVTRADVRLRVLPVQGAGVIADWTAHQIAEIKRNSNGAPLQAQLNEFRDRLVLWMYNPKRAAKQCQRDLERWAQVGSPSLASNGRRSPVQEFAPTQEFAPVQGIANGTQPVAPIPSAVAPAAGPAPVPASTSSIPAAAVAHAQAAAAQPKDPFEDLLGPGAR